MGNNDGVAGTILWDVDTQVDFMEPSGKLYVPRAAEVAPAMERLVDVARAAGVVHVASELRPGPKRGRRARDAAFERGIELLHAGLASRLGQQ